MIDKEQVKAKGLKILATRDLATIHFEEVREKLKALLPNIINSDNILDIAALQDFLDLSETTANNQGYELTFAGKGLAKAQADIPTEFDLKCEYEQSKNFDETDNVVIRGDNIDVLKILRQNYTNKIKMIYIDPPYNTKSENFVYKDNFKVNDEELIRKFNLSDDTANYLTNIYGTRSHSGWLSFMYPRLTLARELLREDGVIFISIDDNEQANLKILCDEIFGEDNFVNQFIWVNNLKGRQISTYGAAKTYEYILCYAKNVEYVDIFEYSVSFLKKILPTSYKGFKYDIKKDEHGEYVIKNELYNTNSAFNEVTRKNLVFNIHYNAHTQEVRFSDILENIDYKGFIKISPKLITNPINNKYHAWRWSQKKIENELYNLEFVPYENTFKVYTKIREYDITTVKDIITDIGNGNKEVEDLLEKDIFSFPKSTTLISLFMRAFGIKNNEVILDFFAGSGTTGDAVMQLNAEDGGKRKFILAQWDEKIDTSKPAYKFCMDNGLEPVISSITLERLNRAGDKIANGDTGYKVFSLQSKRKIIEENGSFTVENLGIFSTQDKLYNMICASSQALNSKIETLEEDKLYKINNAYYIFDNFTTPLEILKGHRIFIDGYSSLSLENSLNLNVVNNEDIIVVY